jgi:hypothetical protein
MTKRVLTVSGWALLLAFVTVLATAAALEVPRMTKEALMTKLDNPDVIILDVRKIKELNDSGIKIKSAVWEDSKNFESWGKKYPKEKTIVLY